MMADSTDDDKPRLQPSEQPITSGFAEGGLQAWLTVLGSTLVYLVTFGFINSFGFFQEYYLSNELKTSSPAIIALIGTLQISLLYLGGPIAGSLFDAYGHFYLYLGAGIGCAGALVSLSFTQPEQLWQKFLTQGILFGISSAFGTQPALAIVGQYFQERRALAMGIVAGGSSIGGVTFPLLFSNLIPLIGFGWTLRLVALICVLCYSIAAIISRSVQPKKPLGSPSELLDFTGFKDVRYATLAIATFISSLGLYVPYYYIQPFAVALNSSGNGNTRLEEALLPIINGSSFFGRILGGIAADRIGRLNILWPMTTACGIFCLAIWLTIESLAGAVVFAVLYGFCSGIFISVTPAAVGQISPREKLGAQIGAFFSLAAIATLAGSPAAGALLHNPKVAGDYDNVIGFAGATLIAGGLLLCVARWLCDRDLKKKM